MSTREAKRRNNQKIYCPFPDYRCTFNFRVRGDELGKPNCPFWRTRYVYVGKAERNCDKELSRENKCIWQTEIKPVYEKERMAKTLLKTAWGKLTVDGLDIPIKNIELDVAKNILMSYCEECQAVTRHNNEGNCMTCDSDFYANHHDPKK